MSAVKEGMINNVPYDQPLLGEVCDMNSVAKNDPVFEQLLQEHQWEIEENGR